ncbi:winged helix-turn-helix transcriptional regulator [Kitasatospora aureofaciens]|uniref:HxlR family transcriptional regulator n=1 Tax=Kitasatospora aureofaciens TaxID=1894 RepID=A0A1E7NG82_KITAU|nr:winged helix-turn-helix transcriptional regulator [Kitasatospora aureofaciens]OEV39729.1 HxlR family transcriptional regulator [Kitasatospora aureofaciens]UKZ10344.1 winged helix-turn-helix transcriptional regulator [Streptomyces viridifaciens]
MRYTEAADPDCAISQALAVVGDTWTLLLIRDVAGGTHQFDALQNGLGISRKVLTERLKALVADGVLEKRLYHPHPPRYEYHLTDRGRGLLPVLVALQDWGGRYVLGDGTLTGTSTPDSAETRRVLALTGHRLPALELAAASGGWTDPVAADRAWTVLYCYPGAYAPGTMGHPPGWGEIPGAPGCTLESCTYRDRMGEFAARDTAVHGVSTQRPDQLAAFADHARIPFPLLSDAGLELAAALRLPTFRAAGAERLKRLTLILDADRTVRGALYPVPDPAGSVEDVLSLLDGLRGE